MQAAISVSRLAGERLPEPLRDISDVPRELFLAGSLPEEAPVAIVGSRKATGYGRRIAQTVAARLATAGVPIVSGLAFGIDAETHRAVLEAGGQTIAVLPGGLDRPSLSPRSNLALADRILESRGALLSEYPQGTMARKEHFLARNRLISGLSRAVVVIEAALPSGSLITAKHATDQGRDVWAVPGPIDSPTSAGTNWLISDGAQPLVAIDHFLESIGIVTKTKRPEGLAKHLTDQPRHFDELAARSGRQSSELESELTKLELLGLARHLGGRYYVRS
jgi:DNA processing protein